MNDDKRDQELFEDLDWENRVLCSDESCIGVIGPDGRCKECGKPYEGELPDSDRSVEPARPRTRSEEPETEEPESDEDPLPGPADPVESEDDDDWENRVLCRDENCIGVIGPDGRCKECGKPYEG